MISEGLSYGVKSTPHQLSDMTDCETDRQTIRESD